MYSKSSGQWCPFKAASLLYNYRGMNWLLATAHLFLSEPHTHKTGAEREVLKTLSCDLVVNVTVSQALANVVHWHILTKNSIINRVTDPCLRSQSRIKPWTNINRLNPRIPWHSIIQLWASARHCPALHLYLQAIGLRWRHSLRIFTTWLAKCCALLAR